MIAIIKFNNFDDDSVQWKIIGEWIEGLIADKSTDNTSPLRYADSVEFREEDDD